MQTGKLFFSHWNWGDLISQMECISRYTFYIHISCVRYTLHFCYLFYMWPHRLKSHSSWLCASQDPWYMFSKVFRTDGLFLKVFWGSNKEINLQLCSFQLCLSMTSWDLDKSQALFAKFWSRPNREFLQNDFHHSRHNPLVMEKLPMLLPK